MEDQLRFKPNRGGCLSVWLVLVVVLNFINGLMYIGSSDSVLTFLAFLSFAVTAFAIGIWNWKKWGVYGIAGVTSLLLLISLSVGDVIGAIRGLVPMTILYFLIKPVWKHME